MKRVFVFILLLPTFAVQTWAQHQDSVNALQVSFPGKTWSVTIDAPGFTIGENEMKPGGHQYLLATNKKTGITLSVTLEQDPKGADANTCPGYLRKRVQAQEALLTDVRYSTAGSMAAVEYVVPEVKGMPVQQKNLIACTAKEDVYVDIHLSKIQFKPERDQPLFTACINAVRIAEASPGAK
jgi:hypothetical protein